MKRRLLGLVLVAAMALSMLPSVAFAEAAEPVTGGSGTISYEITDTDADGTLDTITYSGTGTLSRNSTRTWLPLLSEKNSTVAHVEVGDGVTIGDNAFSGCGITSVHLPSSLQTINAGAFMDCHSLSQVVFSGEQLESIGAEAFAYCSNLLELYIPDSVTSIGTNAFQSVPQIYFNDSVSGSPWGAAQRSGYYKLYYFWNSRTVSVDVPVSSLSTSVDTYTADTNLGFTRTGYSFVGWNTASDGNGTFYAPGASITISGDITLYAQWELANIVITLNNGFDNTENRSVSVTYGNTALDAPGDFTAHNRDGFTLLGYYTAPSGGTRVIYPGGGLDPEAAGFIDDTDKWCYEGGALTLYAQWEDPLSFEITIPATLSIGEGGTGSMTLSCNVIHSSTVTVTVTSAGGWELSPPVGSENAPLPYALRTSDDLSADPLGDGDTAAEFRTAGQTVQLFASVTGTPVYADVFQDTLTFTVSVSAPEA